MPENSTTYLALTETGKASIRDPVCIRLPNTPAKGIDSLPSPHHLHMSLHHMFFVLMLDVFAKNRHICLRQYGFMILIYVRFGCMTLSNLKGINSGYHTHK